MYWRLRYGVSGKMGASEIIIALIGLAGVAVGGVITGLFAHRRTTADAVKAETEADRLRQEITEAVLEMARQDQEAMKQKIEEMGGAA